MPVPLPEAETPASGGHADAPSAETGRARQGFRADAVKLPNLITFLRLILAVATFYTVGATDQWVLAAVLFGLAAGTDALDGYVARRYGLVTPLGRILDPFADKFIIIGCFICLLARGAETGVTALMVIVVFARESFVTSLRGYIEKAGHDFSASWTGKVKMIVQCVALVVVFLSLSATFGKWLTPLRVPSLWIMVAITAYSGIDYLVRASGMLAEERVAE